MKDRIKEINKLEISKTIKLFKCTLTVFFTKTPHSNTLKTLTVFSPKVLASE